MDNEIENIFELTNKKDERTFKKASKKIKTKIKTEISLKKSEFKFMNNLKDAKHKKCDIKILENIQFDIKKNYEIPNIKKVQKYTTKIQKIPNESENDDFSIRGKLNDYRKYTEDGYPIYSLNELDINQDFTSTEDCPFDCNCCT
ncbi:hypothetical protein GVAV_002023 [Gurleya vavrai]